MDYTQFVPWIMFGLAAAAGCWFAFRGMQHSRDAALQAKEEAQRDRDAMVAALQTEIAALKAPRPEEAAQFEAMTQELAALRERMTVTGAELGKLHSHDREIRSMMSSLLSRASKLAEGAEEAPLEPEPQFRAAMAKPKDDKTRCSETDTLHLQFLEAQQAQLEEIRKKSQRLNLMVPPTPANQERARRTSEIFTAIRKGDLEAMRTAIKSGGDPNGHDPHNGFVPLHLAAREGNKHLVAELLALGADACATDNFGKTPLQVAQEVASGECAELLRNAK